MKIIGLCGGSGSGKGTVAKLMSSFGIPFVNADEVYHELTSTLSECLIEIKDAFGDSVVKNGALDRAALRSIVMSDSEDKTRLKLLNSITHKHVLRKMREIAVEYDKQGFEYVVFDAPLLFESGLNLDCFVIICVVADKNIRIERIMKRDGITSTDAIKRIESQLSDEWLILNSDYVIVNDKGTNELSLEVQKIITDIKNKS